MTTPSRAALELADAIVDIVCDSDRGWTRMDIARLIQEKVGPLVEAVAYLERCYAPDDRVFTDEAYPVFDAARPWRPGGGAKP